MNKIDELKTKYPLLFSNDPLEPIVLFGVECDPGWYKIIDIACKLLYHRYSDAKRTEQYYEEILENKKFSETRTEEKVRLNLESARERVEEEFKLLPNIQQIKEKFGELRIYLDTPLPNMYAWGVVDFAEEMSRVTCEVCGAPGETITKGWHKTLCEQHAKERYGNV
jgi:hypothetical protein